MFDFSFAEIALIVVVAVIFIGPKELPAVVRMVSKFMRAVRGLGKELHAAMDDLSRESGLHDIKTDMEREMRMIRGDNGKFYESYDMTAIAQKPQGPAKEP